MPSLDQSEGRRSARGRRTRVVLLVPLVVVVAVLLAPWLPFVNSADLWLGLPSMLVWTSSLALAITPALLVVEAVWGHDDSDEDEDEGEGR